VIHISSSMHEYSHVLPGTKLKYVELRRIMYEINLVSPSYFHTTKYVSNLLVPSLFHTMKHEINLVFPAYD
jgi:hypothetical protein